MTSYGLGLEFDPQPLVSGRWVRFPWITNVTTTATLGNGNLRVNPVWIPNPITLQRLGAEVTSNGDAGSKLRLGIYADDGNGRPSTLVLDAGTVAGDSSTVQDTGAISQPLNRGWYWFGLAVQLVTTTQPTVRTSSAPLTMVDFGASAPTAGQLAVGVQMTGVTGALPSPFVVASVTGLVMAMHGKIA